jgi:hypothetical protein
MSVDPDTARKIVLTSENIEIDPEVIEENRVILGLISQGLLEADKLPIPKETEPWFLRDSKLRTE